MRRSSRVILLLGIFLALGAFVLVLFLGGAGRPTATPTPAIAHIVVAAVDIPQGTTITQSMVTTKDVSLSEAPSDAFTLPERVIGQTARASIASGQYVPQAALTGAVGAQNITGELQTGDRAMALQADELSGVGTLIQPGDRVDVLMTFTTDAAGNGEIPLIYIAPRGFTIPGCTDTLVCDTKITVNPGSTKVVLQNIRVVGTLLSSAPTPGAEASATPASGPLISGRTELVIVAVTDQQAEVLRFGQLLKASMTLLLRSPADAAASPAVTTGIVLKNLIDQYGVLPPQPVIVPLPSPFVGR